MKYVNVIFEKEVLKAVSDGLVITSDDRRWVTEKAQALVPFSDLNTRYDTAISYKDNFERFVIDTFECGFLFLSEDYAIPVFKVLAFLAHKEKDEKPDTGKKEAEVPSPHMVIKDMSDQSKNERNERPDKRMKRHGRWRNFRRMRGRDDKGAVPSVILPTTPTPPTPVPPKSEDSPPSTNGGI